MPTVTSKNLQEFQMREMARRAGRKYEEPNPFAGLSREELKEQKSLIKAALKETKAEPSTQE
jgi:hypothetical protein